VVVVFLLLVLFCCSYVVEKENGKKMEREKRKGRPFAIMKGLYL
jgi:hypothetical protein